MSSNRIHPTAVVSEGVELGEGNVIGPYAVVLGPCRIGSGNWIASHACIGGPPEYRGGPHPAAWDGKLDGAGIRIGDRSVIREFVTINQGLRRPTIVGDESYLMTKSHVGHDAVLGEAVTVACGVLIGGHCEVWTLANLGLGTVLHQFVRIGPGAMVGMGSVVRKEVGAFLVTLGNPARTVGVNRVGLSRQGCSDDQITAIEEHLRGGAGLPDDVPAPIRSVLAQWADRPACGEV
ncbi:MAG: UDP-N-acetylglucosamine acyltransferase [Actinomycetota bacterium]|jgi:UDP-N-acetylglucosamine acyltransferase